MNNKQEQLLTYAQAQARAPHVALNLALHFIMVASISRGVVVVLGALLLAGDECRAASTDGDDGLSSAMQNPEMLQQALKMMQNPMVMQQMCVPLPCCSHVCCKLGSASSSRKSSIRRSIPSSCKAACIAQSRLAGVAGV